MITSFQIESPANGKFALPTQSASNTGNPSSSEQISPASPVAAALHKVAAVYEQYSNDGIKSPRVVITIGAEPPTYSVQQAAKNETTSKFQKFAKNHPYVVEAIKCTVTFIIGNLAQYAYQQATQVQS